MDKYLLAVLVDNKPGVLTHIAGLISRRAFNIESISAGYTEERDVTRINIVVSVASENELRQVVTQLSKLIDVVKIVNLTQFESITRELVLINEGEPCGDHRRGEHLPRAHRGCRRGECRHRADGRREED